MGSKLEVHSLKVKLVCGEQDIGISENGEAGNKKIGYRRSDRKPKAQMTTR